MKTLFHVRQGDVLIEQVADIPTNAKKQKRSKKIILALGEATGHHHALEIADPADWWKQGEDIFVTTSKPSQVTHQEHATIALPVGNFRVTRQRQYTPAQIIRVAD